MSVEDVSCQESHDQLLCSFPFYVVVRTALRVLREIVDMGLSWRVG